MSFRYTYHRTSSFDPNMCLTAARLSPSSHLNINHSGHLQHHQEKHENNEQSIANYGSVILLGCNREGTAHQRHTLKTSNEFEMYSNQTFENGPDERQFIVEENPHSFHPHHNLLNDDVSGKNIHEIHPENSLDSNSYNNHHLTICHENGNGIQYPIVNVASTSSTLNNYQSSSQKPYENHHEEHEQNYYINNDTVIDENVVAAAASIVEMVQHHHHHHHHHQQQHLHQHQYNINQANDEFHIQNNSTSTDLINEFVPASETNFVNLGSSFEVDHQQELIATAIGFSEKNQRFILRRTISPLLAAVNDITQRDAELQSYLNQSQKTNEISIQMNESNNVVDDYDNNNDQRKKSDDINDKTKGRRIKGKNIKSSSRREKLDFKKKISTQVCEISEELNKDYDENYLFIADKPVETRARASLPTNYLYFVKNEDNIHGVFAKREIPERTKFGPFEGEISSIKDVQRLHSNNMYPLLFLENDKILEISNENLSNWMKFVRMAKTFDEQNLILIQDHNDSKIYFRCCRLINPKDELRVGYSKEYAEKFNLEILKLNCKDVENNTDIDEQNINYNRNKEWPCFECDERFQTSTDLQNHLNKHDPIESEIISKVKYEQKKRRKNQKIQQQHLKTSSPVKQQSNIRKSSSRCLYCFKVFMTTISLRKHIASHITEKRLTKIYAAKQQKQLTCNFISDQSKCCYRKFNSEEKLKNHRLSHLKHKTTKPYVCTQSQCNRRCATKAALSAHLRSHHAITKNFRCAYCLESFKKVFELKNHVLRHSINGIYPCHLCGKKYSDYSLARKHIRVFHPGVTYPCTICGRQFVHMNTLRRHMSCHSDRKDFLCSECGHQFKRKDKLKAHIETVHSEVRKEQKFKKKQQTSTERKLKLQNNSKKTLNKDHTVQSEFCVQLENSVKDYERFVYKCHKCMFGFKRRGMLINHMVKRHPEISINSIPELNLPILKIESVFFCPYCTKSYKNNSKRKIHILKNHPGQKLPPSARNNPKELLNAQTVRSIQTNPQRCEMCYKQYATRSRLLQHYRKEHINTKINSEISIRSSISPSLTLDKINVEDDTYCNQISDNYNQQNQFQNNNEQFIGEKFYQNPHYVRPPQISPENKLLKLSSAALELEERKFLDFLNDHERSEENITETSVITDTMTNSINTPIVSIVDNNNHNVISIDDNTDNITEINDVTLDTFSKVDVNFKVENDFTGETSNKLPQLLFEESIVNLK